MKNGIAVVAIVGLLAGLLAAQAGARVIREPSRLSLRNVESTIYDGFVESNRAACERRRTVVVFHDQNRNGVDKSDYRIGSGKTDREGDYEVEGSQAPKGDRIVAQLKQRTLADGTVCLAKERAAVALPGMPPAL
jgi:hypothetical protein